MNAHRIKTALTENGKLSLQNLPFKKGDEVEVIILERNSSQTAPGSYPLKGTVISYEYPFESATSFDDWEALK
ncbi:conserved hypothetical protein [Hyella patelloides LEGE 07179]|uniref:Uncharacterized protein n=1 Tax=Hyella patelloides LEGE 07179 TaxID=945734 RepID=A0A563VUQ6_9CYAN|nr:hypothetical protein [Hyella patelloides]VEP15170.1 conserved hypothetical protein [Hyella patelloides LEGE 07179]